MLNVAPQKERIPDHLRAMAEQDDKSAASGKTGEQSSIGVGCAPGEERDSAISICAVHSTTVTAAIAEFCEDTVEKQKTLTDPRGLTPRRMAEKSSTILVRQRHEEWYGLTSSAATWWRPSTGSPQRRGGTRCRPPSSAG